MQRRARSHWQVGESCERGSVARTSPSARFAFAAVGREGQRKVGLKLPLTVDLAVGFSPRASLFRRTFSDPPVARHLRLPA